MLCIHPSTIKPSQMLFIFACQPWYQLPTELLIALLKIFSTQGQPATEDDKGRALGCVQVSLPRAVRIWVAQTTNQGRQQECAFLSLHAYHTKKARCRHAALSDACKESLSSDPQFNEPRTKHCDGSSLPRPTSMTQRGRANEFIVTSCRSMCRRSSMARRA